MDSHTGRLASLGRLLEHAHARFGLGFGFFLWDGTRVPAALPADALGVAIADEGVVASLLRRPKTDTLANLWASGRLDIVNGTIFDLVARRPAVKSKRAWRSLDKRLALAVAGRFLFTPRGGPWPLEAVARARDNSADAAENKSNIAHHYDVSNAFYALWLDPEMVYTCAYFREWDGALAQAQIDKLDITCRKLRLKPGETLLDIGCGWGALCCHAAQHYGVIATGVTLSEEQVAYAREKVARLGLQDRVRIELMDFAAINGSFDKAASLGMAEHVGAKNLPTYYATVARALKPGGLYLHHAIARPGKSGAARGKGKRPEFAALTRYIFPGGDLESIGAAVTGLERHGFEIHDIEGWREHYQRTCRAWHDNLLRNFEAAVAEVGPVKARVWLMYLAACSIAFERNNVGVYQTLASKRVKGASGLPPTRADLYAQ